MTQTAETHERRNAYACALCQAPATMTEKSGMGYCDVHWRAIHPHRLRRLIGSIRNTPTRPEH